MSSSNCEGVKDASIVLLNPEIWSIVNPSSCVPVKSCNSDVVIIFNWDGSNDAICNSLRTEICVDVRFLTAVVDRELICVADNAANCSVLKLLMSVEVRPEIPDSDRDCI